MQYGSVKHCASGVTSLGKVDGTLLAENTSEKAERKPVISV
jgi:hypothetical protein